MQDAISEYRAQREELKKRAGKQILWVRLIIAALLLLTLAVAIDVWRSPIPAPENFDAAAMQREAARRARRPGGRDENLRRDRRGLRVDPVLPSLQAQVRPELQQRLLPQEGAGY